MALNDTFTIQEINLDKKDLSYDINPKELEAYWNKEYAICRASNSQPLQNFL